jgi:hypothetical protein
MRSLSDFNKLAAGAHFLALVGFAIVTFFYLKKDFTLADIFRLGATAPAPGEPVDTLNYPIQLKKVFTINVPYLILFFFASTVFFHLLYAYDYKGLYSKYVKEGWNPIRWYEYAISASVMTTIIGCLSGMRDVSGLAAITISMGALQLCGLIVEREATKTMTDAFVVKIATSIGWALFAGVWGPILFSFFTVIKDARQYNARIPRWLFIVIFFQLFNFALFGLNQMKQVRAIVNNLPLPDFETIERQYIKLSFSSKLVLGAGIGYGLLGRQNGIRE